MWMVIGTAEVSASGAKLLPCIDWDQLWCSFSATDGHVAIDGR